MTDPYWVELAIARHEACHAIAAQKMGLPVSWVTVVPGRDEDQNFGAAVKIPDEGIDLARTEVLHAVCVALAAPSRLHTGNRKLDAYAMTEYAKAMKTAELHDLDAEAIHKEADDIVEDYKEEILLLADRLLEEGTVSFDVATA